MIEFLESLFAVISDMARLMERLASRVLEAGLMTDGEAAQLNSIRERLDSFGIEHQIDE